MATSNPFPVLTTIAKLLRVVGWIIAVVGCISIVLAVIGLVMGGERQSGEGAVALASACVTVVGGFATVAYGELIGVAFAIEANTRRAAEAIASLTTKPQ